MKTFWEKLLRLPPETEILFEGEVEVDRDVIRVTATDSRVYEIVVNGDIYTTRYNKDGSFKEFDLMSGYDRFLRDLRWDNSTWTTVGGEDIRAKHIVTHEKTASRKLPQKYILTKDRSLLWETFNHLMRVTDDDTTA